MKQEVNAADVKAMNRDAIIYTVLLAATIILPVPLIKWFGLYGLIPELLLWGSAMYFALRLERIKKANNVQSYREILAFSEGKRLDEIEQKVEAGKRPYQKVLLALLTAGITLLVGMQGGRELMRNGIEAMITDITATTAEAEDYTGEDGLLYCGKCHTPKEAYFSKETAQWLGHDRHPAECDCQRAAREKREAAESRQKHLETVEDLKRRGFTDPAMRNWTFEHDNGRNPQTETARFYVESWETMQAENIGYLFWGGVGTGKSYLAACIANALMEKEVAVCMTNFATILNDLAASFEGRNEYISRLCSYPLLILDDFGMVLSWLLL